MNLRVVAICAVVLPALTALMITSASEPAMEIRRAIPAAMLSAAKLDSIEVRAAVPMLRSESSGALSFATRCMGYRFTETDTLEKVAVRCGSTPGAILAYNRLESAPAAGQLLVVPSLLREVDASVKSRPVIVERGAVNRPRVAVTLDAGSGAGPVPEMLRVLRERDLKITFFLTGDFIKANPELVRQMTAEGHEFGNHSLTHPDFRKLSDEQMRHELLTTERLLNLTSGATTRPFFRPPYGEYNDRVLLTSLEEGFLPVYWSLDSLDSVGASKTPRFLFDRMTARLSPEQMRGAIFLMHCDSDPTATALPMILDRLRQMGLEVAKLSRVLNAE